MTLCLLGRAVASIVIQQTFRIGRRTILLSFTIVDNILLVLYVVCAELSPLVAHLKYGCLVLLIAYAFVYGLVRVLSFIYLLIYLCEYYC